MEYFEFQREYFREVVVWLRSTGKNQIRLNNKIYFPPNNEINKLLTVALNVLTSSDVARYTADGMTSDLYTPAQMGHFTLTLKKKSKNKDAYYLKDYPLSMLSNFVRSGKPFLAKDWRIDVGNSYVKITDSAGLAADRPLVFFWYVAPLDQKRPEEPAPKMSKDDEDCCNC